MGKEEIDLRLNCVGQQCPMPGINTRRALDELESGKVLEIVTDGMAGRSDVPRMAKRLGHDVLSVEERNGLFVFRIRKK